MKKTSTLYSPLNASVSVNAKRRHLQPSPVTIAKICQYARCAFATNNSMPLIILN